jgi:Tol biopolymer transport system component
MRAGFLLIVAAALLAGRPLGAAVQPSQGEQLLQRAIQKERVDGDLKAALKLYQSVLDSAKNDRAVAAEALLRMGQCHEKLGSAEARAAYERVVRDYPDQAEKVQVARQRLSALDSSRASGPVARRLWRGGVKGLSPDGRYVVYMDGGGNYRLKDLQTEKDTPITNDTLGAGWSFTYAPVAISPDNRYVAYTREVGDANELRVSALDGSGMRVLHRSANRSTWVLAGGWTPDGKKLIVLDSDGSTWHRGLLDVGSGSIRYVGQRQRQRFTRWGVPSPDGRFIAYDVAESQGPQSRSLDVFLYDTVADRDIPAVSGPANDKVAGWSATGRELLFIRSGASSRDLWSLSVEKGKPQGDPQLIKSDIGNGEPLHLSRSGVLYQWLSRLDINAFIAEFDISTGNLRLPAHSVNELREQAGSPRWSSDGLSLFYGTQGPSGDFRTLVIRSEASGVERRVSFGRELSYLDWLVPSPDGRSVALPACDKDVNCGVFLIDPSGGASRKVIDIAKAGMVEPSPNWSPDGKAMYYKCRDREAAEFFVVMRRNLETGTERQIYRGSFNPQELVLSPDGTRFAFFHGNPVAGKPFVLMSMDEVSGEMKELDRVAESVEIQAPTWSADGKRVLYTKKGKGSTDLWWVPAAGGTPERLVSLGGSIFTMAMHPKGNKIAYTQKSTTSELWALENLFSK